jgi:hypothetical protein
LVLETLDEALSGLTDFATVIFSAFPGVTVTVALTIGASSCSAFFFVDLVDRAGATTVASTLTTFLSVFLGAVAGVGFSTIVVLTFLVVTLGSDAPVSVVLVSDQQSFGQI